MREKRRILVHDGYAYMSLEAEMTLGSTNAVIGGSDELSTDILVSVLDASGSPVSGATITISGTTSGGGQ